MATKEGCNIKKQKRISPRVSLVDILYFAGAALVSVGFGAVFLPAGLMAGGASLIAAAFFAGRPEGGDGA